MSKLGFGKRESSVPVPPKEQEVSLIVESDDLSSAKLGKRGKEGAEEPSNGISKKSGEVVQDGLG